VSGFNIKLFFRILQEMAQILLKISIKKKLGRAK
jgi:hypothetical protein